MLMLESRRRMGVQRGRAAVLATLRRLLGRGADVGQMTPTILCEQPSHFINRTTHRRTMGPWDHVLRMWA